MKEKGRKKYSIYIFTLLTICFISYEFLFCNAIFLRSIVSTNLDFSPYVFSLPRIVFYLIFYVIAYFCKDKIIDNRLKRNNSSDRIINKIFTVIYIAVFVLVLLMLYKHVMGIMTLGIMVIVICYLIFLHLFIGENIKINVLLVCLITFIYSIACQTICVVDEVSHLPTTYNIAHLNFDSSKLYFDESLMNIRVTSKYSDNQDLFVHYKPKKVDITNDSGCYLYDRASMFLHIPSAIGLLMSEFMGGTVMDTYYIGRISSVLFFMFLLYLLMKKIRFKKYSTIATLCIPYLLLLASTYGLDGIGFASVMLFITYVLDMYYDDSVKNISNKSLASLLVFLLLISLFKGASYIFVVFLMFLLRKKMTKKQKLVFTGIFMLMIAFVIYNVYGFMNYDTGDTRGGDTSIIGQLHFVFSNPIRIIVIPIIQIFNTLFSPIFYQNMAFPYLYGKYGFIFVLPYMLFTLLVSLMDEKGKKTENRLFIIIFILLLAYTSASMYLTFTPVGSYTVGGYQSRYVFQFLPLLLFLLPNKYISIKNTKNTNYYFILFILAINVCQFMFMLFN